MDISNQSLLKTQSFINGEWVNSEKKFKVFDPATGDLVIEVSDHGATETAKAIESAHQAFKSWKNKTATERSVILKKWFDLILENKKDLAFILTKEMGKPYKEALGEINYGVSFIEWFAEESKRAYGDVIPSHREDARIVVTKQAVGVVGAITPWNFPNAMITRKVAPALAAGCTVVIKPSEETPLSALALAELANQAGFPEGVLNVVVGLDSVEIGKELTSNKLVRKISFTGSTRVGKILMEQSASTLKKLSLELGGNAPFIVFDDADIDEAVKGAINSKYRNGGQTCVCSNRIFVHEAIYEEFLEKYIAGSSQLKVGNGFEDVNIGPMINRAAIEKVDRIIEDAVTKGAKKIPLGDNTGENNLFYSPTIIANATSEMACANEEIFGPVAPIFKFSNDEEVIEMANDTDSGLAAYFYSKDLSRAWRVSEALDYGMVGINEGVISTTVAPFGGVKESGFGREGSKYGLDDYLDIKYIMMKI